jgi:NAD(P)-dependent dehydrogenase (short-subunit alcohol dehydrogenase family)
MELDPRALFGLEDKVALLTGASSGLGRRFAAVLAAAGATVVASARRVELLASLAAEVPRLVAVPGDVTVAADRKRLVEAALAVAGRIDVLVNNAGAVRPAPALDEAESDFREVLEVNLTAPFLLTQAVARVMVDLGGGAVVNVASILGLVGSGRIPEASYAASKAGLVGLTRELAAQWARRAIRVNALAPGWFASEMTGEMLDSESGRRYVERATPMGRPGAPDELDGALLFLASDASRYMTGQVLTIDGGWTAV